MTWNWTLNRAAVKQESWKKYVKNKWVLIWGTQSSDVLAKLVETLMVEDKLPTRALSEYVFIAPSRLIDKSGWLPAYNSTSVCLWCSWWHTVILHTCSHDLCLHNSSEVSPFRPEFKDERKMEQHVFRHPDSFELRISVHTLLYLIISPMLSVSLKSFLTL